MPAINGTLEAISIKPMPQPDNYGNTFRASIKVNGEFYSYGSLKKDAINIKDGSDWIQLQKGMGVEFMYQQNGDFRNIKKSSLTVTDNTPAPQKQQQRSAPQQQTGNNNFVNPAEVGQCLNLAVEVMKLSDKDLLNPAKVKEAIGWYKAVRTLFSDLYPDVEATQPKAKKAPAKKAVAKAVEPEPDEVEFDEDDLPF